MLDGATPTGAAFLDAEAEAARRLGTFAADPQAARRLAEIFGEGFDSRSGLEALLCAVADGVLGAAPAAAGALPEGARVAYFAERDQILGASALAAEGGPLLVEALCVEIVIAVMRASVLAFFCRLEGSLSNGLAGCGSNLIDLM
jgi:hypothetical protein